MSRRLQFLSALGIALACLLSPIPASAWGNNANKLIVNRAIETLPPESDSSSTSNDATRPGDSPLLEDNIDTFWQAGEGFAIFTVNPTAPRVDKAVLKRLGDAPFTDDDRNLTALLSKAYDMVDATINSAAPTWLVSDRSQ